MFAFHRQPLKAINIYLTYFITTTIFIRLPVWAFMPAIPALRPRPSWPFRRALILQAVKALVQLFFDIGFPVSTGHDPEKIAPSPAASESGFPWIVGEPKELADRISNNVQAVRTAGYWFYASPTNIGGVEHASSDELVILHLHSGGHVMGSAHPKGGPTGPACNGLESSTVRRKSNGFLLVVIGLRPPLRFLRQTRFRPAYSIVSLVFRGGNLAISLVRHLASNASSVLSLPVPRGLVLTSPSVEWGVTHDGTECSWRLNSASDYSIPFFGGCTQESLLGNLPIEMAYTSPWTSPASQKLHPADVEHLFQGFPATFVLSRYPHVLRPTPQEYRQR
ncbi:hypothetical protein DFH08DRAFT_929446 [Mycena albidolilacea]|uniref:Uncharacterized protein n=1 Tax=Mycena albidolilacea TaxID=1033008 RepID=A0AAD7ARI2_9AGAR|nr:hypothetical protein DFH08DRAFT_929446 [Mycena albidolilacea]